MNAKQKLCRFVLFTLLGFKEKVTVDVPDRCIIALAPHTSNLDFFIGNLYSRAVGRPCNFLMKNEWFFWPLGIFMKYIGGIPVYRNKRTRFTDVIAEQARRSLVFRLCITPEGTRKANKDWKMGFYYIAYKAELPILLYGLDYKNKSVVCTKIVKPTGNVEEQMKEIKEYFRDFNGLHPQKFAI